ncbi:class I SAM-dependent methyltransferase [Cronobacter sakazakii]|uniref:class I SAM-dependent methyltransferase n=2 Tax=Cronobacter sakazakii TaxID=28141 RepID=UPI000BE846C7|nr:class I SAM-dependent methyltransferase [Cronobacter sakazakii]EGT5649867.1 class I SAM-dependent methyltransferase [Cronobacter sakazakii]EGT5751114.1 class I SAM-dependent methyltransferase [Cronobacter sakazakii]EIZ8990315.1 class I SAM-dependent methyltransferase [Cronobacter sakazakii]EJV9473794.1 class I SAM-dependent methyltransferase [Cronobacter sakazakii]EKK4062373.1 class I SAM-dependent methyltransferase [Cronobacter sakazakii]
MTQNYYQAHAHVFFEGTVAVDMSSLYDAFTPHLPAGTRVLDAGCGSGRDALAFRQMGYEVEAFDACGELVALARAHSGLPVKEMTFSDLAAVERYDGIWCCASLLHLSHDELPTAMQKLSAALKPGGVWYLSFKYGEGEREQQGRRFTDMNEARLTTLLAAFPELSPQALWVTQDKRPERTEQWLNGLLVKR